MVIALVECHRIQTRGRMARSIYVGLISCTLATVYGFFFSKTLRDFAVAKEVYI